MMNEYFFILGNTTPGFNWTALEAIATVISDILIFCTLIFTIYVSRQQIKLAKQKYEQAIEESNKRQSQQTYEIVQIFSEKMKNSLLGAISFLNDNINYLHYVLNEANIKYLENLKQKANDL